MKPNRYIKAMEIGLANEKDGISYFDLVYGLHGTNGKVFARDAEYTFYKWFRENFDCIENVWDKDVLDLDHRFWNYLVKNEGFGSYHSDGVDRGLHRILQNPFFLRGAASKQYLDYVELKESRKAAMEAKRQSNISIVLAIAAIIISAILGLVSLYSTQDVKVIEDNMQTMEQGNMDLKQKNDSLTKELYKANMMVRSLEEVRK